MKLYVMRHGPAEEQADSGADDDRALTAAGRSRVCGVATALAEASEEPTLIVTSPLVRAVQTAEIVAIVTKLGERSGTVQIKRGAAPGGDGVHLVHELVREGRKRVMLVGHEPDLSTLVTTLLSDGSGAADAKDRKPPFQPFEKAMVVGLHLGSDAGRNRLRFVLDPKTLRLEL
jgi:phosphohistidine phosphatase